MHEPVETRLLREKPEPQDTLKHMSSSIFNRFLSSLTSIYADLAQRQIGRGHCVRSFGLNWRGGKLHYQNGCSWARL